MKFFLAVSIVAATVAACTAQQIHTDDAVAIDLTNAVCAVGEVQPLGQPYVDVVCTIAQGVEKQISIATAPADAGAPGDAGAASSAVASVKVVHLQLTKDQAAQIVAAHSASSK